MEEASRLLESLRGQRHGWLSSLTDQEVARAMSALFENASTLFRLVPIADLCKVLEYILSDLGPEAIQDSIPLADRIRYIRAMIPLFVALESARWTAHASKSDEGEVRRLEAIMSRWWTSISFGLSRGEGEIEAAAWESMEAVMLMRSDVCSSGAIEGMIEVVAVGRAGTPRVGRTLARLAGRGIPLPDSLGVRIIGMVLFAHAVGPNHPVRED